MFAGIRRAGARRPTGRLDLSSAGQPGNGHRLRRGQFRPERPRLSLTRHRQKRHIRGRGGKCATLRRRRRLRHGRYRGATTPMTSSIIPRRGPCADGRHKPDLVAPGTHVSGGVVQAPNPGAGRHRGRLLQRRQRVRRASAAFFSARPAILHRFLRHEPFGARAWRAAAPCLRQYFVNNSFLPPSPGHDQGLSDELGALPHRRWRQ